MSAIITHEGEPGRVWLIEDVFLGPNGTARARNVPLVGDFVLDRTRGYFEVVNIDQTLDGPIPELRFFDPTALVDVVQDDDLPAGLSRNFSLGTNNAFADFTVSPAVITIDPLTYIYGTEAIQAKIFRGTDISATGVVISRVLNAIGDFVTDTVTLEQVLPGNNAIKRVPATNIDVSLQEGELVTVVGYSASGGAVYVETFQVRLSSAIRTNELNETFIVDIELTSPLISPTDNTLILNNFNVPFNTNLLSARLIFNDGNIVNVPIDGVKMRLLGLGSFNESILGSPTNILLQYTPDANEQAVNLSSGATPVLSRQYRLANIRGDSAFALKLFIVPTFTGQLTGYNLRFFLGNDEYTIFQEVTLNVVVAQTDGSPFSPTAYQQLQELTLTLLTNDVLPGVFNGFILTQNVNITLDTPTAGNLSPWIIDYIADGSGTLGFEVGARFNTSNRELDFRNDFLNLETWLENLYEEVEPIFDPVLLGSAPMPTHFRFEIPGYTETAEIADWDNFFQIPAAVNVNQFDTATITWILQPNPSDPEAILGITPLVIRNA